MPVPLITFGLVILRTSLKPMNKVLVRRFQSAAKNPMAFKMFAGIGYYSEVVEDFITSTNES